MTRGRKVRPLFQHILLGDKEQLLPRQRAEPLGKLSRALNQGCAAGECLLLYKGTVGLGGMREKITHDECPHSASPVSFFSCCTASLLSLSSVPDQQ